MYGVYELAIACADMQRQFARIVPKTEMGERGVGYRKHFSRMCMQV